MPDLREGIVGCGTAAPGIGTVPDVVKAAVPAIAAPAIFAAARPADNAVVGSVISADRLIAAREKGDGDSTASSRVAKDPCVAAVHRVPNGRTGMIRRPQSRWTKPPSNWTMRFDARACQPGIDWDVRWQCLSARGCWMRDAGCHFSIGESAPAGVAFVAQIESSRAHQPPGNTIRIRSGAPSVRVLTNNSPAVYPAAAPECRAAPRMRSNTYSFAGGN